MATDIKTRESRITPLFFDPLEPDGRNFLDWHFNMRTYLSAEQLDYALQLQPGEETDPTLKWQALLVLRRHLDPSLRMQYLHEENPATLWAALESRFQHEETIILPQA